jgi:hypothetical protein
MPDDGILHSHRRENLKPYNKELLHWRETELAVA